LSALLRGNIWSQDQALHTSYQSDGNMTRKMKRKSLSFLSKSGKWRSNGLVGTRKFQIKERFTEM
jgi:hypothetical protein